MPRKHQRFGTEVATASRPKALARLLPVPLLLAALIPLPAQDLLGRLGERQNFGSKRISSFDRTGGNRDSLTIEPGKTVELAAIRGPAAIHHIWTTIAAEPFYGRKIVLRVYWDGEETPSVEAPVGDFFGVGHGLNRNLSSLPIANSSEGRARNCYWLMPFRWSCRVTATNEGTAPVDAFYYYVDYRELPDLKPDAPYFHAQYRQENPCEAGRNYLLLDAVGSGHFVGSNLSILQKAMGWWGEGDDMIYVDGETEPSLHGTGSEDYFSDAWGMREGANLFYGCPLQEEDFQAGSKATVYRFHIPDPVVFKKSIRVTIEHGHANDRADDYSSVAYWYQTEPHVPFPTLPPADKRLPFALATPPGFVFPEWRAVPAAEGAPAAFEDGPKGLKFSAPKLSRAETSSYNELGRRYPVLVTEGADSGTWAEIAFPLEVAEPYQVDLYLLKGPAQGNVKAVLKRKNPADGDFILTDLGTFAGYAAERGIAAFTLRNVPLEAGPNIIAFNVTGKDERSTAQDLGFVGLATTPSARRFVTEWNLIGTFDAPDMNALLAAYPPEREADLAKSYPGKGGAPAAWKAVRTDESGFFRLAQHFQTAEQVVVYGLAYVQSPDDRRTHILLGSDDGVRLWINDEIMHSNPAYRGAYPDQDRVYVRLKKGWNKVLIKILQGAGGWGFYFRAADPKGELRWALKPGPK